MICGVFGIMIIGSRDHIGVDPALLHRCTEFLYSVCVNCAHLASVICISHNLLKVKELSDLIFHLRPVANNIMKHRRVFEIADGFGHRNARHFA